MAELGIAASIVGLLTTGAKLSVVIFDFASTVGSAEQELYSVGKEISLFCSVLEQVQNLLSSRTSHFSVKAIEATQNITDHCDEILQQIGDIIEKLMKSRGPDLFPSMEFIQKVKWTFRRPKVLQLQKTLEGCKLTLHLMLTSSDIARKRSSHSTSESSLAAIAREKLLTQSLLLSRQSSIQELGALEDEMENESKPSKEDESAVSISNSSSKLKKTEDSVETTPPLKVPTRQGRASIWLQALLPHSRDSVDVHPGMKYRRMSSHDASLRSAELLEWWTVRDSASSDSIPEMPPVLSTRSPFSPPNKENNNEGATLNRAPTDLISPTETSGRLNSYGFGDIHVETHGPPITPMTIHLESASETRSHLTTGQNQADHKSSHIVPVNIHIEDSLPDLQHQSSKTIIDQIKRQMTLSTSATFTLAVVYGGKVREFKGDDKPLDVVSQFDQLGLDPFLMIRTAAD